MRWVVRAGLAFVPCVLSAAQTEPRNEVVDEDYRFRLAAPGRSWQVLAEERAVAIVPDSVAVLVGPGGRFAAVIVEEARGTELEAMARLIHDGLEMEERADEAWGELELQGRPAFRYRVSGRIDGQRMRVVNTVFMNGGLVYQLVCIGPVTVMDEDGRAAEEMLGAFSLLDGTPRMRASALRTPDLRGYDWRVADGVLLNAAYGIELAPPSGWRVIVGSELEEMNSAAEVGAVHTRGDLYLVVIAERVIGYPPADLARLLSDPGDLVPSGEPLACRLGGADALLQAARDEDGVTYFRTAVARDEHCIQLLAWHAGARTSENDAHIAEAVGALRFLSADERARRAAELGALPDPESEVGPDFSLRDGLYRDYGAGFSWRRPPGWRIRAGQRVRADHGDTVRIELEHPGLGVSGWLDAYVSEASLRDEHEQAVLWLAEGDEVVGAACTLGGVAACESLVRDAVEPASAYHVVSAQRDGLSFELVFTGYAGNMAAAEAAIDAAIAGFRLELPEVPGVREGVYVDEKLGFSLARPGPGFRANTALVPGDMAALSGTCGWSHSDGREVFAIALGVLTPEADERGLADLLIGEITRTIRGDPVESADTLDGLPARRLVVADRGSRTELLVARRGNSLFLLGVSGRSRVPTLAEAQELFEFLP